MLRATNPSPYMYLLRFAGRETPFDVVGSSPEALVTVTGTSAVVHPPAGTRPRGATEGVYIDGRLTKRVDASGPRSALTVLQNPRVDFAVFEVARGGILREGLGYGRNDVAVVLNVTGDHLGLRDIDTIEQLAAVKRVIVEAVPRDGYAVLNADDELVLAMRRHCPGNVILFTMNEDHELIERWVRRGRKAVGLTRDPKGEQILLRDGRRSMPVGYTHQFPATFDGRARMNVQNLLAAVVVRARLGERTCTTSGTGCARSRPTSSKRRDG